MRDETLEDSLAADFPNPFYLEIAAMQSPSIRGFYYITHIDNLPSIVAQGILSHERVEAERVEYTPIFDSDIVNMRRDKFTADGKSLWHYANLFFQPRNPMLYRIVKNRGRRNLAVFSIANTVLQEQGVFITDGIALSSSTRLYRVSEGLQIFQAKQEILQSRSWISWMYSDELRRELMAECLVPNQVNPVHIRKFIVSDRGVADSLRARLSLANIWRLVVADDEGNDIFTPPF